MRWLVPLLVVFAGCAEPPVEEVSQETVPSAVEVSHVSWELDQCRYANVFIPASAAALAPYIPEGFELTGGAGSVRVPGVTDAYLGYEAFACASGVGLDGRVAPMAHGGYFTSVVPPPELRVENSTGNYLRLLNLVPDEARRTAWEPLGFPVVDGSVEYASDDPAVVSLSLDGDGTVTYGVAGAQGTPGAGGWFVEYMVGDGSMAVWQSNYTVHTITSGQATIAFPAGSLGANILGLDAMVAPAITGTWDFHDGHVRWWTTTV